ncbi:MAG TPA: AMP-binding protein [Blastocatellia bacterium]|nr:AMP-binding protein [Blastocatellia bacterium]
MKFASRYPDVPIPETPYHTLILQNAANIPDKLAFIDGPSGRTLAYRDVESGARRIASSLARRGFRKGDVFAIVLPNVPEYALVFHGVLMLGGVVTTANPLYTVDELAFQLNDTRARFVVTVATFLDKVGAAARRSGTEEVFVLGEAEGATPIAALLQGDGIVPEVAIHPRTDLAVLPYSSGTSGRAKGVMLTHYNLVSITHQIDGVGVRTLDENARVLAVLPFFHIYGMVVLMNFPLYRMASCVTMPRFDLEPFLQIAQDRKVTHLYVVPPILIALAKHPVVSRFDLSSVRFVNSGAAPLAASTQIDAARRLNAVATQGYGMTETSAAIAITPGQPDLVRAGSVGLLLPNMEAQIVDPADGVALGPNENGEIWVRGPNVMRGYLDNAAANAEAFKDGSWFHTGDIGHVDEDGYLYIVDRVKELIKYKGMQVAPAELEGVLLSHPAIAEGAVIPIPDEEAGEIPKAFVVLKGNVTPAEIMDYVAARVAPHMKIRSIEIVSEIPKSPTGKLLRRVLVERERARRAI